MGRSTRVLSWSLVVYHLLFKATAFNIIECHLPNSHCYADDSQIYLSFKPDDLSSQQDAKTAMQNCIDDIRSWMEHDKLLLNDEKTEFLVIGTRQQLSKVITVGNSGIMKSSVVGNLGSYIDDKLSMNSHIKKVSNASFYYLHNQAACALRSLSIMGGVQNLIICVKMAWSEHLDCGVNIR